MKWSWRSRHVFSPQQNVNKYSKENNTMYLTESLFADDTTVIGKVREINETTQVMKGKHRAKVVSVVGLMLRWVQAWLSNKLTWVTFDGEKSKTIILKQGVPQRSLLSPLLFPFYINDLPNGISQSNVSLFADDVAV